MGRTSFPSRNSTSTPGAPGLSHKTQSGGRGLNSSAAYIEIDDDVDELATGSIPCSSPYFTQPTQIVGRATQPTQLVNREAPRLPSSPIVPSTPSTVVEVPASSPFQDKSQARPSVAVHKPSVPIRIGSLMAPAGTSFKPPAMQKASSRVGSSAGRKGYLDISDDDLLEDYKKQDSSDDGTPARGDIRPSSFVKRDSLFRSPSKTASWSLNADISLNEIRDVRLRHLTSQVYKIVRKIKPDITVRACKEALQKDVGWQVSKAVDALSSRSIKMPSLSKSTGALSTSTNGTAASASRSDDTDCNKTSGVKSVPTPSDKSLSTTHTGSSRSTLFSFLKKPPPSANSIESSRTSTQFSRPQPTHSQNSHTQLFATQNSDLSIDSSQPNRKLPRNRLVQGRDNSSTPSAIFSISSSPSESAITSPADSRDPSPEHQLATNMSPNSIPSKAMPQAHRRLIQGRRDKAPSSSTNTSKPAPTPLTSHTTPSSSDELSTSTLNSRDTRSRKRQGDVEDLPDAKRRKMEALKLIKMKQLKRRGRTEAEAIDLASPPKKAKTQRAREVTPRKRKPVVGLEESEEEEAEELDDDSDSHDEVDELESSDFDLGSVLEYLNTCTAESLGRMIGSAPDAKVMISARPFESIADAEKVSRHDKTKSRGKAKKVLIGEAIVEKLTAWIEACEAATTVINECDRRGAELNAAMDSWPLDRNGEPKPDTEDLKGLPIKRQPNGMNKEIKLKKYQLVGLNWMNLLHSKGYSGILADDMGLGKTCQVISFITHLVESKRKPGARAPWPNLIVVPSSTYENWLVEFETFAPDIKVQAYSGQDRRNIKVEDAKNYHVVLTTYAQVERQIDDLKFLQQIRPYAAIFDEGHKLKNQSTLIYKQMMRVPTKWRLILSGTPVQNNLQELLSILHFIEPNLFEARTFQKLRTIFEAKVNSKDVLNFAALASERVDRARKVMAPFILQRRKDDVLDLPPKIERVELVGMHDTQKEIYDGIRGKYIQTKGSKSKNAYSWMAIRKAAIHHQLFRTHFTDRRVKEMADILWNNCSEEELQVQRKDDNYKDRFTQELLDQSDFHLHLWCKDFERYIGHLDVPKGSWEESPKVQKLLELVRGYMKTGDRVLVFSRFEMVVDILKETMHHAGIPYCLLTGNTPTEDRFPECQRFTENPEIPVFLITTGAGGTGLNLTAANKIIIFDQSENPQDDVQASNRAHRIGQKREVEVIRLITEKSVECLIYNSCVKKLVLAARVEREFGVEEETESVEEQCKKRMLLGEEESEELEPSVSTQLTKAA
ncbi:SNF2 family N-terminal domain-containing protein [Hypomontagnella submonticulosa]|nr:SNF2 family N-terminal domain-containing protein [Hypomontagnella submonticulosa]